MAKKEKGEGGGSMWVRKENESNPIFYLSSASIFSTHGKEADNAIGP